MKDFKGKLAVITGAGTGMGRELALQLVSEGCSIAICDVLMDNLAETEKMCKEAAAGGAVVSAHECDVSEEDQMIAFRDAIKKEHNTDQINLLFNNAGAGGGGSFLLDDRADWDKIFGICWGGVYYGTRAFMPMLLNSTEGYIVNVSSVNGFWACLGPAVPHTAYSSAKFAVKGFSEALRIDLRLNAPHVKVSVVMPGHIGTSISLNSTRILGHPEPADWKAEELKTVRENMTRRGMPVEDLTDDQLIALVQQGRKDFRDNAPCSSTEAATIILDGVRNEQWRILIGDDAVALDRLVREYPEEAYEESFVAKLAELSDWALAPPGSANDSE
ncbi:MAG: SDR family oxidoreductase [Deltaproteobacteria bacterium]|nr:SDR family oxidoreductase [Deltaproteobacteria bacterium]